MALPIEQQLKRIEEHKRKDSLVYSILDGSAFSVMAGFGENYFNAFAIELGASNQQMALFTSLPQLIGSCSQAISAFLVGTFKRRTLICMGAFLQAITWLPLILIPFFSRQWMLPLALLFIVFYFVFGNIISPAWNSLMGDLVTPENRGKFFGKRNKVTGCVAFLSIIAAGIILDFFQQQNILLGFSLIFGIALAARMVSLFFLSMMVEPLHKAPLHGGLHIMSFLQSLHKTNTGLFIMYLCLMNFSVQVAGPFFSVFMLRDLQFSYIEFMIVNVVATVVQFLTMTYWGASADYYGNKKIITITGLLLPIVPWLWLPSSNVFYLMIIQIVSGFAWAGFNLASVNFIFDNTIPAERINYFAYYNVLNGLSVFLGASIGGYLAMHIISPWIFVSPLQFLFLISGVLRALVSFIFLPLISEVRTVHPSQTKELFWNLVAVRPLYEMRYELVLWKNRFGEMTGRIETAVEERINRVGEKLKRR